MSKQATRIVLGTREERGLLQITRRHRSEQRAVLRAHIVLAAAQKRGLQPHRFRYWLTEVPDGQRDEKIREGCEVYASVAERATRGERTISLDELTGVQARERKYPDLPMQSGHVLRREFEYIASDSHATKWHLVLDNLNIHQSESLVRWIAEREGIDQDTLGVKGKLASYARWKAERRSCMSRLIRWSFTTHRSMPPG